MAGLGTTSAALETAKAAHWRRRPHNSQGLVSSATVVAQSPGPGGEKTLVAHKSFVVNSPTLANSGSPTLIPGSVPKSKTAVPGLTETFTTPNRSKAGAKEAQSNNDDDSDDSDDSDSDGVPSEMWDQDDEPCFAQFAQVPGSAAGAGSGSSNSGSGTWGGSEYPGFAIVGPDLYARTANPQLLMNECAVRSFVRANYV